MLTPENREEMAEWVREILGPEKAQLWWKTPNPMLGGMAPWTMAVLSARHEEKLYRFIDDAYHAGGQLQLPQTGVQEQKA